MLDAAGFVPGAAQSEGAVTAIRGLTALGPLLFLALAVAFATRYRLGRAEHAAILQRLGRAPR